MIPVEVNVGGRAVPTMVHHRSATDQEVFDHLDGLSRERALSDWESRLLEKVIRRLDDRKKLLGSRLG